MNTDFDFMLVDDDPTSNLICKLVINQAINPENIHIFLKPENGLDFIESYLKTSEKPIILLLDINMPSMTGWEFLEKFITFDQEKRRKFKIFILSSAIQDFSKEAERFPFVIDFLSKPLKSAKIKEIVDICSLPAQ